MRYVGYVYKECGNEFTSGIEPRFCSVCGSEEVTIE